MTTIVSVKEGDSGPHIRQLQSALIALGYNPGPVDGKFGSQTKKAVKAFQEDRGIVVDGVVGRNTLQAILSQHGSPGWVLKETDILKAALELGVSMATIKAISEVETENAGFVAEGMPTILFERHWMYKQLRRNGLDPVPLSVLHPDIVSLTSGGYRGGKAEWERFNKAAALHRKSAIESTSWGRYQIMGFHYERLGFESPEDFVFAMSRSESDHLAALVRFIKTDAKLHEAVIKRNWKEVARIYNGPKYANNNYDVKLAKAFEKHRKETPT